MPRSVIIVIAGCCAAALTTMSTPEAHALHPIAQSAADTVADPESPFVMIVTFTVPESNTEAFLVAMAEPRVETVKESGNLAYALTRSVKEPKTFHLYEHWESVAALQSHLNEPYLVKLGAALDTLLDTPPQLDFYTPVH